MMSSWEIHYKKSHSRFCFMISQCDVGRSGRHTAVRKLAWQLLPSDEIALHFIHLIIQVNIEILCSVQGMCLKLWETRSDSRILLRCAYRVVPPSVCVICLAVPPPHSSHPNLEQNIEERVEVIFI